MGHRTFSMFLWAVLLATLLCAQQDRGAFTGTVTDPTGAVIPGVKITATNVQTNTTVGAETNVSGQYRLSNLPIGDYRITFEAKGFKTSVRDGLRLSVTDVIRVDGRLEVGATSESLTVTAEAPLLQTETPEVSTLMGTRQVIDLPMGFSGGRYAEDFAFKLTPGVGGDNWTSHINGAPSFSKEVLLDGASGTIYISGHMGESTPSMEALEEFKVQTSAMGQIHNEWMDANSFANNFYGRPRQRDRRNEYAFSAGGPIVIPKVWSGKDKFVWYAAYEKYNESYAGGGSPTVNPVSRSSSASTTAGTA